MRHILFSLLGYLLGVLLLPVVFRWQAHERETLFTPNGFERVERKIDAYLERITKE